MKKGDARQGVPSACRQSRHASTRTRSAGLRVEKDDIAAARLRRRKSRGLCFRGLRGSRESLQTLDCFSSSNRSGCFGLKKDESPESRSSAVPAALRTIPGSEDAAAIAVFWGKNEFRPKMNLISFAPAGANSARLLSLCLQSDGADAQRQPHDHANKSYFAISSRVRFTRVLAIWILYRLASKGSAPSRAASPAAAAVSSVISLPLM